MRIWDLPPGVLCRQHLLGEHRELHAVWNILIQDKKGYRNHPEVKRWENKLCKLWNRHELQVEEMKRRGYSHNSPLEINEEDEIMKSHTLCNSKLELVNNLEEQKQILREKGCDCEV